MKHIVNFQKLYNLTPDGKIGPNTLRKIGEVLDINSKEHLAHFMGQIHHETGGFDNDRESMNYTPQKLLSTFKGRITPQQAFQYGRTSEQRAQQVILANIVYGGRWGNINLGNTKPNDGWDFRGNAAIQTTGRYNHQMFSNYVKDPEIMKNPDLINQKYYFESAVYYFDVKDVWQNCNVITKHNILLVSKHVNLGKPNHPKDPNHLDDREKWTFHYYEMLKDINL